MNKAIIPGVYFEYLAFASFWAVVVALDLKCLWSLRRSRVEAIARFLWMIWVVGVPIIGAITYFIVQPTREEGEMGPARLVIERDQPGTSAAE